MCRKFESCRPDRFAAAFLGSIQDAARPSADMAEGGGVRVILDANAVDPLVDEADALPLLRLRVEQGCIEVLYTHVTLCELAAVNDLERRQRLLLTLVSVGELVPTGGFVLGKSRLGLARLSDGSDLDVLRSSDGNHTLDALVGVTARFEDAVLVTADRRLSNRARKLGVEVMTMADLLVRLRA